MGGHRAAATPRPSSLTATAGWSCRLWVVVLVGGLRRAPALFGRLSTDGRDARRHRVGSAPPSGCGARPPSGAEVYAVVDGRRRGRPRGPPSRDAAGAVAALPGVEPRRRHRGPAPRRRAPPTDASAGGDGRWRLPSWPYASSPDPAGRTPPTVRRAARAIDAPRVLVGGEELLDDEMEAQASGRPGPGRAVVHAGRAGPAPRRLRRARRGRAAAAGRDRRRGRDARPAARRATVTDVVGLRGQHRDDARPRPRHRLRAARRVAGSARSGRPSRTSRPRCSRTFATAGRTVAFSGLTVAASLAGLLVFPDDFLRSMGVGRTRRRARSTWLAALTLLPALLGVVGHRIRPPAAPRRPCSAASPSCAGRARRRVRRRRDRAAAGARGRAVPRARGSPTRTPGRCPRRRRARQLAEVARPRFDPPADVEPVTVVARRRRRRPGALGAYAAAQRARRRAVGRRRPRGRAGPDRGRRRARGPRPRGGRQRSSTRCARYRAPSRSQVTGDAAELVDYEDVARGPAAVGARRRRAGDVRPAVPVHRLGGAAGQGDR